MKIICEPQYKELIEERLKEFEFLPITLLQQGFSYDHPAIAFHIDQLEEVANLLKNIHYTSELMGEKDGRFYPLKLSDILFFEIYTQDSFAYTMNEFYKIHQKVNYLENDSPFIRVSRNTIVNTNYIQHIMPSFASKLTIHMKNDMEIDVNRAYVKEFKKLIGMKVKK